MLGRTRGAQREPPKRCPGASPPPAMPFIDLLAQSLRGDERVIAAIRRTRALARIMALERRAFVEAVKRHPGVAEMVARELARPSARAARCEGAGRGGDGGG